MKGLFFLFVLTSTLFSCKKDSDTPPRIINGVNVSTAVSTFNSFRTQGITGYPAVNAVTWNDTLSLAAYNFAKAKTEDVNTPPNNYNLSNGQTIFSFPAALSYSKAVGFALFYGFPAEADVSTVINAGFSSSDQFTLTGLMNPAAKQFGMGQFGGKWYLMTSN